MTLQKKFWINCAVWFVLYVIGLLPTTAYFLCIAVTGWFIYTGPKEAK
jgi:hypothetical protein